MTSDKTIPPGGEGEIKATVNPKGRSGKLQKSVTVNTNDPEHRAIKLTIKADVLAAINIEPRHINFGQIEAGAGATKTATILVRKDVKTSVTGVESNNDQVKARLLPKRDDKGRYVVEVSIAKDAKPGPLHSVITINTTEDSKVKSRLTTRAEIMGDLTYAPRALNLRAGHGKVTLERRKKDGPPFRVLEAHSTVPQFKVKMSEVEKQARYEFDVTVEPTGDIHRGALEIKTNNKRQPLIKVPLSYVKPRPPGSRRTPSRGKPVEGRRRIKLQAK